MITRDTTLEELAALISQTLGRNDAGNPAEVTTA